MKKKKIILSFDYELFFGIKSGTVQKTLIEPTNELMNTMEECGFRGNFFIDVLMIKYLKMNTDDRSKEDLELIENQLRDMVRRGHRIELHLHPHWVDAKYNGDGTWDYTEYRHYSLNSFSEDEIIHFFKYGSAYLNSIGSEINPNYRICAFRAGGWAVQPFGKLKKAFLAVGIKIDSSSGYGAYEHLKDSYYDFRNMPHKDFYNFEDDVCEEVLNGSFLEVPITTQTYTFGGMLHRKLYPKLYKDEFYKSITDGTHDRKDIDPVKINFIWKLKFILFGHMMMSFSQHDSFENRYIIKHSRKKYFCFIDHPKDYSLNTSDAIRNISDICSSCFYYDIKD